MLLLTKDEIDIKRIGILGTTRVVGKLITWFLSSGFRFNFLVTFSVVVIEELPVNRIEILVSSFFLT